MLLVQFIFYVLEVCSVLLRKGENCHRKNCPREINTGKLPSRKIGPWKIAAHSLK